jgi:hypothetical protein
MALVAVGPSPQTIQTPGERVRQLGQRPHGGLAAFARAQLLHHAHGHPCAESQVPNTQSLSSHDRFKPGGTERLAGCGGGGHISLSFAVGHRVSGQILPEEQLTFDAIVSFRVEPIDFIGNKNSGRNEMDPPLCGSTSMSHKASITASATFGHSE